MGFSLYIKEDALIVKFNKRVKVLSSAPLNGGLRLTEAIVNVRVSPDFNDRDPEGFLKRRVEALGLPEESIGFMTAVDVRKFSIVEEAGDFSVSALVTAGLSHPSTPGEYGTINIILIVDA
ncbi:MAG: adenosylcobinamide amidohydrolase, partial [Nitrososphaerota archaeon]